MRGGAASLICILFLSGCGPKKTTEGTVEVHVELGANFDTTAVTGILLTIDNVPGQPPLDLAATASSEQSVGGHRYTSQVADCDNDGANEFCVTYFASNRQRSRWLLCASKMARPTERRSQPTFF